MPGGSIGELFESLTPSEKEAVLQFIGFLRGKSRPESPFMAAVDEFIEQHPELLRRLAH